MVVDVIQQDRANKSDSRNRHDSLSVFGQSPHGQELCIIHFMQRPFGAFQSLGESVQNLLAALRLWLRKIGRFEGLGRDCRAQFPGAVAMCRANWPSQNAVGCGFQASLFSGIRSSTRLVVCASWSISIKIASTIGMTVPLFVSEI